MFSENEKISMRQLKRNQLLLLLNLGILLVPLCVNGGSAAVALLAILLLAVFVLWSVRVEAPPEGSPLRLPGRSYFWVVGTMIARMSGILVQRFLLTETHLAVILGWFYLFLFYNLYKGLECRMRVSEILFTFCVAFLVLLPLLMLGAVKVERLQELQWSWSRQQFADGYGLFCWLAVVQGLWYLKPAVNMQTAKTWKGAGVVCALAGGVIILLCGLLTVGIYGAAGQTCLLYPLASAMTLAHFPGNVIGRLDTVFVLAWVLGLFLVCSTLFAPLEKSARNKWKNAGLAVILLVSYLLALTPSVMEWGDWLVRVILVPAQVVVLLWQTWKKRGAGSSTGNSKSGRRVSGAESVQSGFKAMFALLIIVAVTTLCTACGKQELETQSLVESLAIDEGQEISFVFAVAEDEGDSMEKSGPEQGNGSEGDNSETDNDRIFTTKAASIHDAMDIYGDYHQKKLNLNHLQYLYVAEEVLRSEQLRTILEELQLDEQFSRGILLYVTEGMARDEALDEEKPEEGTPVHELLNAWYNQGTCELPLVTADHRYKGTIIWQYSDQ